MFDTLFRHPTALRRHRDGPLADERVRYLTTLASQGSALATLRRRAHRCLAVARMVATCPGVRWFTTSEIDDLITEWEGRRVRRQRITAARRAALHQQFVAIAMKFLRSAGRWTPPPPVSRPYARQVDEFLASEQRDRLRAPVTCRNHRWQVDRFLSYLTHNHVDLGAVTPEHLDGYFQHAAPGWSRVTLQSAGHSLRVWFRYCEAKGWVRPGLAAAILVPRVYRDEGIPIGPTWDAVARGIANADGDSPLQRRNAAILRLLSIYGLRSGEVRRLQLADVDFAAHRIQIIRSKSGHREILPLEPAVAHALTRYVEARPTREHKTLFLTVRAPFRPLSSGALYGIVASRMPTTDRPRKGRGPHGLRHACARQLTAAGLSFKQVGDHLGHRSPDSTRIYAKVNLAALRLVAVEDLGGLL
jgi:site-specific recombinase XerD